MPVSQIVEIIVFGLSILGLVYRLARAEAQIRFAIENTKAQSRDNDKGLRQLFESKFEIFEQKAEVSRINSELRLQKQEFNLESLQDELDRRVRLLYRNQKQLGEGHKQIIGFIQNKGFKIRGTVTEIEPDYKNTELPLFEDERADSRTPSNLKTNRTNRTKIS